MTLKLIQLHFSRVRFYLSWILTYFKALSSFCILFFILFIHLFIYLSIHFFFFGGGGRGGGGVDGERLLPALGITSYL